MNLHKNARQNCGIHSKHAWICDETLLVNIMNTFKFYALESHGLAILVQTHIFNFPNQNIIRTSPNCYFTP